MTKRNITIVGIILILIAIAIISIGRSQVQVPPAAVREPAALNVGEAVVRQANLTRSVGRELANEVSALASMVEVATPVNTLEVNQPVAAVHQLVVQGEQGVELAVVLHAAVPRVDQVQASLV